MVHYIEFANLHFPVSSSLRSFCDCNYRMTNFTHVSEFVLLGFKGGPGTQTVLFLIFLVLYVIAVVGNFGMIIIIKMDAHLHTPMYAFLQSLSFLDICYSSTIAPRAVIYCLKQDHTISFGGCATQFFFYLFLVLQKLFSWLQWLMTASLPSVILFYTLWVCLTGSVDY